MLFLRQKDCRVQIGIRTRVFVTILNFHDLLSCTNKWKINKVKERFIKWKLAVIREDIWRGQIGPATRIFDYYLHFNDSQSFASLWQLFPLWGSLCKNWTVLVRIFEGSDWTWSWNSNFYDNSTNYLLNTKISDLALIIWELTCFIQNICRGQIGLRTIRVKNMRMRGYQQAYRIHERKDKRMWWYEVTCKNTWT